MRRQMGYSCEWTWMRTRDVQVAHDRVLDAIKGLTNGAGWESVELTHHILTTRPVILWGPSPRAIAPVSGLGQLLRAYGPRASHRRSGDPPGAEAVWAVRASLYRVGSDYHGQPVRFQVGVRWG